MAIVGTQLRRIWMHSNDFATKVPDNNKVVLKLHLLTGNLLTLGIWVGNDTDYYPLTPVHILETGGLINVRLLRNTFFGDQKMRRSVIQDVKKDIRDHHPPHVIFIAQYDAQYREQLVFNINTGDKDEALINHLTSFGNTNPSPPYNTKIN